MVANGKAVVDRRGEFSSGEEGCGLADSLAKEWRHRFVVVRMGMVGLGLAVEARTSEIGTGQVWKGWNFSLERHGLDR